MAISSTPPFKVAYYKSGQANTLYSEFFTKFEDAVSFSKTLSSPYLIFRKQSQAGDEFAWELMPYGYASEYKFAVQVIEYKWLIIGLLLTIAYIAYKMKSSNGAI